MPLPLALLSVLIPYLLWWGPALLLRRIALRHALNGYEYLMLGLLLPWLAPFALRNEIRADRGLRRP